MSILFICFTENIFNVLYLHYRKTLLRIDFGELIQCIVTMSILSCTAPFPLASAVLRRYKNRLIIIIIIIIIQTVRTLRSSGPSCYERLNSFSSRANSLPRDKFAKNLGSTNWTNTVT